MTPKWKELLKRIRRLWCKHDEYVFEAKADIIAKYKNTRKGYKLRFDVWENRYCPYCGKLINRTKLKSDFNESQTSIYLRDNYS